MKYLFSAKHPTDAIDQAQALFTVEAASKEEAEKIVVTGSDWDGLYGPPVCLGEVCECHSFFACPGYDQNGPCGGCCHEVGCQRGPLSDGKGEAEKREAEKREAEKREAEKREAEKREANLDLYCILRRVQMSRRRPTHKVEPDGYCPQCFGHCKQTPIDGGLP